MAAGLALFATASAAATSQEKCDEARVKAWRKYVPCIEIVIAKVGGGKATAFVDEHVPWAKCRHAYFSKWNALQGAAYGGSSCAGSRFIDNGNGTVTDNLSSLVWEKKTDDGSIHDWDDSYTWSAAPPYQETGTVFTSFLPSLNAGAGFAGSNGWRLPTLPELQSIEHDYSCTAGSCVCGVFPCVDPALDAATTQPFPYWSATTFIRDSSNARQVYFADGTSLERQDGGSLRARGARRAVTEMNGDAEGWGRNHGTLEASAGSLPASSSSRSRKPSSSRSTPMRWPEPGGTQVKVSS